MTILSNDLKKLFNFGRSLAICAACIAGLPVTSAWADSHARIVRLSDVQGSVQMSHGAGEKLTRAFINLPLVEGSHVKTGPDGRAEVEFEDGSTLRLATETEIDFSRLTLADDGSKLNTAQLVSGMVYANVHTKKGKSSDEFVLNFARDSVTVPEAAHFRLAIDGTNHATLAVFKGKCSAKLPSGQFEVTDKHSAGIKFSDDAVVATVASQSDASATAAAVSDASVTAKRDSDPAKDSLVIAKNYVSQPSDDWDRQQSEYHDHNATTTTASKLGSPYAYGMSDLNYYGNFMNVPGYGNVWQPFFTGANWSPFQDGGWAFYPGAGYSWVSGYQWGWMPYHYGTWAFAPGYGWFWQPGLWNSYAPMPHVVNAPKTVKLPTAPTTGRHTTIVGRGLTVNPPDGVIKVMTITPGSAGLGVPRGSVDHLNHIAKQVDRTSRPVSVAAARPIPLSQAQSSFPQSHARGMLNSAASPISSTHQPVAAPPRPH